MDADELNALAKHWERDNAQPAPDRRTPFERRQDMLFECGRKQPGADCLPCLLDELE